MKTTSLEAFEKKEEFREIHEERILKTLSRKKNLTYNEIADKLNWKNPNKVSRRITRLVRIGKAKIDKVRKCSIANSNCNAYLLA